MQSSTSSQIEVSLNPEWSELDKISGILKSFLDPSEFTEDHFSAVYMVTTELVENGIKYGYFPDSTSKVRLILKKKRHRFIMEVKNPIKETELEHLKRLDSKIQWIRGYQNPFEAYVERLKEVSSKHLAEGESGLGLVRIAYEGQAILDFFVNEENILAVSAVYEY